MLWWLALGLARAGCDNAELQDRLAQARARYAAEDEDGFYAAMEAASASLGCLHEPLSRSSAAEWLRASALEGAVRGGPGVRERVVGALRAGLELDPTLALFPGALPESYWSARYAEARALTLGPTRAAVASPGAGMRVDGVAEAALHPELPAVVQCVAADGEVLWTRALPAGEAPPTCEAPLRPTEPAPAPPRCADRMSRGATWGLAGGTLALVGSSAALYLWNTRAIADYESVVREDGEDALRAARFRTNLSGVGSVAAGALAGVGGAALVWKGCF